MKVKSLCSFNRSSGRRRSRENGDQIENSTRHLCPITRQNRPLFEVPLREKMCQGGRPLQVLAAPKAKSNPLMVCADAPRGFSRAMRNLWEPATNMG